MLAPLIGGMLDPPLIQQNLSMKISQYEKQSIETFLAWFSMDFIHAGARQPIN